MVEVAQFAHAIAQSPYPLLPAQLRAYQSQEVTFRTIKRGPGVDIPVASSRTDVLAAC